MSDFVFPKKLLRKGYPSDEVHTDAAYDVFKADFLDSRPIFRNTEMGLKKLPIRNEREATFYHMTTEGNNEEHRVYDCDRTERLPWAKPLIEHEKSEQVRVWSEKKKGKTRIHLWLHKRDYLLVIQQMRKDGGFYYLPWTAFAINYSHYRQKLESRWKRNT